MLRRWTPPTDEGASLLRLLNLIPWTNSETPDLLCGPLYAGVAYFTSTEGVAPHPLTLQWQPHDLSDPLQQCVAWRVAMWTHLVSQGGVLSAYFPTNERRTVVSRLYACLDSTFPLLTWLDKNHLANGPKITVREVYLKNLAPEQQRHSVIDASCTHFISDLLPYILTDSDKIPATVYEDAGCPIDDTENMALFIGILRQVAVKRQKLRGFLSTVFNTLRGDGDTNWLASTIVVIVKYALLGNYPGATAFVDFRHRRAVYNLNRESVLHFLTSCSGERSQERENELYVTLTLMYTALAGTFCPESIDYRPMDAFVNGWNEFARTNQRVMQLIVDFYPLPAPPNLVADVFRFLSPLTSRSRDIFYALASRNPQPLDYTFWHFSNPFTANLNQLDLVTALITRLPLQPLLFLQQAFVNSNSTPFNPENLNLFTPNEWNTLCAFACHLVDRRVFAIIPGSQALYFEQSARMLKITGKLSPEKSTLLYCTKCSTVRFRPVGIHLPASHITLLADLNFMCVYCVDCDSPTLQPVNLLGQFIRCYLSTKKTRTLVTLTLCSACMHICVTGFYATRHGTICSECMTTVQALVASQHLTIKGCLACSSSNAKAMQYGSIWTVFENNYLTNRLWCNRCMPAAYAKLHNTNHILDVESLKKVSYKHYSVPIKYRHY